MVGITRRKVIFFEHPNMNQNDDVLTPGKLQARPARPCIYRCREVSMDAVRLWKARAEHVSFGSLAMCLGCLGAMAVWCNLLMVFE